MNWKLYLFVAASVALLASCGPSALRDAPHLPRDPHLSGGPSALIGHRLPDLYSTLVGSAKKVALRDFEGKALVVILWSSYDDASVAELRDVQDLVRASAGRVTAIGVDTDEVDERNGARAVHFAQISFPNLLDHKVQLGGGSWYWEYWENLFAEQLPTTVVVRRDGTVAAAFTGPTDARQVKAALRFAGFVKP